MTLNASLKVSFRLSPMVAYAQAADCHQFVKCLGPRGLTQQNSWQSVNIPLIAVPLRRRAQDGTAGAHPGVPGPQRLSPHLRRSAAAPVGPHLPVPGRRLPPSEHTQGFQGFNASKLLQRHRSTSCRPFPAARHRRGAVIGTPCCWHAGCALQLVVAALHSVRPRSAL